MKKYLYSIRLKAKYFWLEILAHSIYFSVLLKLFYKKFILKNIGLLLLICAAAVFITYNYIQYANSFDRCTEQMAEVRKNLATLDREIKSLNYAIYGEAAND